MPPSFSVRQLPEPNDQGIGLYPKQAARVAPFEAHSNLQRRPAVGICPLNDARRRQHVNHLISFHLIPSGSPGTVSRSPPGKRREPQHSKPRRLIRSPTSATLIPRQLPDPLAPGRVYSSSGSIPAGSKSYSIEQDGALLRGGRRCSASASARVLGFALGICASLASRDALGDVTYL